jgi:hypothetical protein
MESDNEFDMESNYERVLAFIEESELFKSEISESSKEEISYSDSINVIRLFNKGVITYENIFAELGLIIFNEYGHYGIADARKWMLGKIKYGI